jgi:hypothetical protein
MSPGSPEWVIGQPTSGVLFPRGTREKLEECYASSRCFRPEPLV